MTEKKSLGYFDISVFIGILTVSIFIGLYHGLKDKIRRLFGMSESAGSKQATTVKEYLVGNSNISPIPIAFSIFATFMSASGLLGIPAEIYQYGYQYWLTVFTTAINLFVTAFVTGPFFAKLNIISVFEYFELRFETKTVRFIGMIGFMIKYFFSAAIYIYGPATSLSVFTKITDKYAIAIIGFIGTLYTAVGGVTGVIWTDFFQGTIMIGTYVIISLKGILDNGGLGEFIRINSEGNRFHLFEFNPDPFIRQSFWSILFGNSLFLIAFSVDQMSIQRYLAARSKKEARIAFSLSLPAFALMTSLCAIVGNVLYATYAGCDPIKAKYIKNPNQLVGYYVSNNLSTMFGLAGLFLACLFSASLSSVSSTLNSQSAIIWEDLLKLIPVFKKFSDKSSLRVTKLSVCVCGALSTLLAYLISTLGGNLVFISVSVNGCIMAPILGLFILGSFTSITNSIGAISGFIAGFIGTAWINIGSYRYPPNYQKLPTSIEKCLDLNTTLTAFSNSSLPIPSPESDIFIKLYSLSFQYYTLFGASITIIVGLLISILTGGLKNKVNKRLLLFRSSNTKKNQIYHFETTTF